MVIWQSEGTPEWRDTPPWLMDEMVASEPALARSIGACGEAAGRLADRLRAAVAADDPIVVTGCGTSEHAARAVGNLLDDAIRLQGQPGGRVEVRQALEAALDPRGGLCIGVSHDGATRATILALEAIRAAGGTTALITARADAPATAVADEVCVTPQRDRPWRHTVAYLSLILVGGLIAEALSGPPFEPVALGTYLDAVLSRREQADGCAAARELALKVEEGARMPASMRDVETLLRGHLAAGDDRTGLVFIATDPGGGERATRRLILAAQAARRVGVRVAAIVTPQIAASLPSEATDAGRLAVVGTAVVLQLVTLGLVRWASTRI